LSGCGKTETIEPIEALDNPTVTSGDVQDFNTIV
jgi:ABC-type lipoprotein export system ATPase subunit